MKAMYTQKPLHEQVVVITGSSSGIGLACAKKAGSRGARVVATSNDETELQEARDSLRNEGIMVECVTADVSDYEALRKVAEFAKDTFSRIDTWINDAGVHIFGKIEKNDTEDMRRLFEVNYWGVVHGCRVAVDHMKESGGTIINIGSVLSARSVPLQGIYSASKHAVQGYTNALRMELEKENVPINVTLIKPSAIATPIVAHSKNLMPERARLPFPLYDPEVAADAILFCAENPRRSFIVGGTGKAAVLGEKFLPMVVDKAMEMFVWNMQKTEGEPRREDELYEPAESESRVRGKSDFYVRKYSIYNTIIKNSLLSAGIFSIASVLFYLKLFRESEL